MFTGGGDLDFAPRAYLSLSQNGGEEVEPQDGVTLAFPSRKRGFSKRGHTHFFAGFPGQPFRCFAAIAARWVFVFLRDTLSRSEPGQSFPSHRRLSKG